MNKIERIRAAIEQRTPDRVPFCIWYHFGTQHMPGEALAEATLNFYRTYELDFVKVMHDYPYELPGELEEFPSPNDISQLTVLDPREKGFREQLKALRLILEGVAGECYVINTIFSPWTVVRRIIGTANLLSMLEQQPGLLRGALETIARSLASFMGVAIDAGLSGIFYSVPTASRDVLTDEQFELFSRPYDHIVLEAARGAPFNILHVHGRNLAMARLSRYPAHVFHWSDRNSAPSLSEGREKTGRCVMGGVDETDTQYILPSQLRRQVSKTIRQAGPAGLIIAPGCSVAPNTPPAVLRAFRPG